MAESLFVRSRQTGVLTVMFLLIVGHPAKRVTAVAISRKTCAGLERRDDNTTLADSDDVKDNEEARLSVSLYRG